MISFTNKAVGELRERINGCLHINCPITTFHSAGYAILRKGDSEGKRIVDGGYMYAVINKYLKSAVMSREDLVKKLILFFGSYFTAPYEGDDLNRFFRFVSKADFSTLKSNLHEYVRQIVDRKTEKYRLLTMKYSVPLKRFVSLTGSIFIRLTMSMNRSIAIVSWMPASLIRRIFG